MELQRLWLKTYTSGKEHIKENLVYRREYTILVNIFIDKYNKEHEFCQHSITKELNNTANYADNDYLDTETNTQNISWNNIEDTKNILIKLNTRNGWEEVDVVDEDGNIIDLKIEKISKKKRWFDWLLE